LDAFRANLSASGCDEVYVDGELTESSGAIVKCSDASNQTTTWTKNTFYVFMTHLDVEVFPPLRFVCMDPLFVIFSVDEEEHIDR